MGWAYATPLQHTVSPRGERPRLIGPYSNCHEGPRLRAAPIRVHPHSTARFGSRQSSFTCHEVSDVLCAWKVFEGDANARAEMHLRVCRVTGVRPILTYRAAPSQALQLFRRESRRSQKHKAREALKPSDCIQPHNNTYSSYDYAVFGRVHRIHDVTSRPLSCNIHSMRLSDSILACH